MAKRNSKKNEMSSQEEVVKDKSPRVIQRDKIKYNLNLSYPYEMTSKQKELLDLILDKKNQIIFVNGPAGTSKTLLSAYAGLELMNQKRISDIIYVRSIIESASRSMGALPGMSEEKFLPFTMPLHEKLHEILPSADIQLLTKEKRIEYLPINFARGASFNVKYIFVDESQNFDVQELTTIITRLGRFSKIVICGDSFQSDIGSKSGFKKFYQLFDNEKSKEQGIQCFSFTREDIVRNGILRYVMEVIEDDRFGRKEPMFLPR